MSGLTETEAVVQAGTVATCSKLLNDASVCTQLKEQCVWMLGNIAAESTKFRDVILEEGVRLP
jgi:hypothetical protein